MHDIYWQPRALRELEKINPSMRDRLLAAVDGLKEWPSVRNVKSLKGALEGFYRLAVRDYRVIFAVDSVQGKILVMRVVPRKRAY